MQALIKWLLDLQLIDLDDPGRLSLQWLRPLDGWMWFVIGVAVLLYVAAVYRRESAGVRIRVVMAACRASLILLAVVLLCEPALVYRQDRVEPSTLAIMIDDSASMARADHYDADTWAVLEPLLPVPSDGADRRRHCTRWDLANAVLERQDQAMLRALLQRHELRLFRFAGALSEELQLVDETDVSQAVNLLGVDAPAGLSTNLSDAIRQVFEACIDAHLAGIVLITDGQPTQTADWERVVQISNARDTAVFPIVTGSPQSPRDLALQRVQVPRHAYVGDKVGCAFTVQSAGLPADTAFEVVVRDRNDDAVLASGSFRTSDEDQAVEDELQLDPPRAGRYELVVEVRPADGELNLGNNSRQTLLSVVEDRARVLYVEGYPRYEYRYLKNTLLREPSVTLSTLLLSADEHFIQEGDEPIRRFPATEEELDEYDVILFGDVDAQASWITPLQLQRVADFVTRQGGGLGFLAGEYFCPQRFYGTALETLVPVELSGHVSENLAPEGRVAFKPKLTPAGRESPMLRLFLEQLDRDELFARLPSWYWASLVRGPRPGAEVLLEHPLLVRNEQHLPVVVVKRHGAGTVLFQGSDDTWRRRRHHGESFFDTYWLQVVRYLAQQKQFPAPQGITLRPNKTVVDPQDPLMLSLSIDDPDIAMQLPDEVRVRVRQTGLGVVDQVALQRLAVGSQHFQGTFRPRGVGQFEAVFQTADYAIDVPAATTLLEVRPQWLEQRRPEANLELMRELAERTGGQVFDPRSASQLPGVIPTKEYTVPNDLTETIWDSKLALIMFMLLIVTEWLMRKRRGLT